jgi:hypothetical protein
MREPKFSDAPCFGKEFDASSKLCRVCLANKPCQRKYFQAFAASPAAMAKATSSNGVIRGEPAILPLRKYNQPRPAI